MFYLVQTNIRWNLAPFSIADRSSPLIFFGYLHQRGPSAFATSLRWDEVSWLRRPFQNVNLCVMQPFSHHFSLVLRVVVMLKPSPSKFKLPCIFLQVFLDNFITFLSLSSFNKVMRTCTWSRKTTLQHHRSDSWPLLCLSWHTPHHSGQTTPIFVSSDRKTCLQNMLSLSTCSLINFNLSAAASS